MNPTFLYIKEHVDTGLKYFGKTTCLDPNKYKGSGTYWKKHIKKHGTNIRTIWVSEPYYDNNLLEEFALFFSEFHNIVDAKNIDGRKIWANLMFENGLDGVTTGTKREQAVIEKLTGRKISETHRQNIRNALLARSKESRESAASKLRGRKYSEERKEQCRAVWVNRKQQTTIIKE